jgi:hypothetical protein
LQNIEGHINGYYPNAACAGHKALAVLLRIYETKAEDFERKYEILRLHFKYLVGFWQSKYAKIMFFELFVCLIHNPPLADTVLDVSQMGKRLRYSLSTYISAFMLVRVYLLFRLYTLFSRYRSTFADRCCAKIGIEADSSFSLKCVF